MMCELKLLSFTPFCFPEIEAKSVSSDPPSVPKGIPRSPILR